MATSARKRIQYVYRRYGERGAAMTANVITYRIRSAVREIAKVLGFPPDQIDRLARLNYAYEFRDQHDEFTALLRQGGVDPEAPRIAHASRTGESHPEPAAPSRPA